MRVCNFIFLLLCCSAGCSSSMYVPEFLTDDTLRLEIYKKSIFQYDPLTCQYSYNTQRKEFKVFSDNMSDYYYIQLEKIPSEDNTYVTAKLLSWTSPNGSNQTRRNIDMEVVKMEDKVLWLWYSPEGIKLTIRLE